MNILRTLGVAALALAIPAHALAQTLAPPQTPAQDPAQARQQATTVTDLAFQRIAEEVFRPVIAKFDIPGIAIGVTLRGRHFVFVDGLTDRSAARPVDGDTLFELGSNSKLFTAALAALAEQRGLMSLDEPVASALPELAGTPFDRITLADLGAHATGDLPLQVPDDIADVAGLMDHLSAWTPQRDPGTTRAYSNVGIGLLGLATARRFAMPYPEAMSGALLDGLGLGSTFIDVPDRRMADYAFGHTRDDGQPVRVAPGLLDAEAYGIKSSVTDMTRFLAAHLGDPSPGAQIAAALARTRVAGFETAHYAQAMIWEGYPWPVGDARLEVGNATDMALSPQPMTPVVPRTLEGAVLLTKTGATNGYGVYVAMIPAEGIGVVVLANRPYPNAVRATATRALIARLLAATDG